MAATITPTGLTVEIWREEFFVEVINSNKFFPYMGSDASAIIQIDDKLTGEHGESVTFSLVNQLDDGFVEGSAVLEGNESEMRTRSFNVVTDQLRTAVELQHFEMKKTLLDQLVASKSILRDKVSRKMRDDIIVALGSINGVKYSLASEAQKDTWLTDNTDRVQFGALVANGSSLDHSVALATIDNTSDKLTAAVITLMKRRAKSANPIIKPIAVDGSDMYILFAPSLHFRDLSLDTTILSANREARARGLDNPIFKGAGIVYDNVIVIEVEDIPILTGVGAAGIDVSTSYLCGAQAVALAWSEHPHEIENERDYKDKKGIGIAQIRAVEKMLFGTGTSDTANLKDHGVFTGYFAAVADA